MARPARFVVRWPHPANSREPFSERKFSLRMQHRHARAFASRFYASLRLGAARARAQAAAPTRGRPRREISFTISMPRPDTHLLQVGMRVGGANGGGSPPRSISSCRSGRRGRTSCAVRAPRAGLRGAGGDGPAARVAQANKNTWRVETGARASCASPTRSTPTSWRWDDELNDRRAFWNNAALLMHPGRPHQCALDRRRPALRQLGRSRRDSRPSGRHRHIRAENFDTLYDSPSSSRTSRLSPSNVRASRTASYRGEATTTRSASAATCRRSSRPPRDDGRPPYRDYTSSCAATASGGLEHPTRPRSSSAARVLRPEPTYTTSLRSSRRSISTSGTSSCSGPTRSPLRIPAENYTRLLWVAEGGRATTTTCSCAAPA